MDLQWLPDRICLQGIEAGNGLISVCIWFSSVNSLEAIQFKLSASFVWPVIFHPIEDLISFTVCLAHVSFYVFTGYNGTINGRGKAWWTRFRQGLLKHTRGPLVQFMWSKDIIIYNITLQDSPFWTIHPYDCKNVTISNVTILAPLYDAPNTDGIDPGKLVSLTFVCCSYVFAINSLEQYASQSETQIYTP